MKTALITDVHANAEALQAVLADARARGAGAYAFLGDFVGYGADPAAVVDTVRALVADGAVALTTSCGFLARWQAELQAALPVPVWTSALLWLPVLAAQRPGVVTVDGAALDAAVLRAAGAAPGVPVQGIHPGSALARTLLDDLPQLDAVAAEATVVDAARALCAAWPDTGVVVLECTNMPPYRDAVARACGRPVHDVMTLVHARWAALAARP